MPDNQLFPTPAPDDTPAPLPMTVEEEIAAAEALLTPEQRAMRQARRSPIKAPSIIVLDRSTLERSANCPMQGVLSVQHPNAAGKPAQSGSEAHEAVSQMWRDYIEDGATWGPQEVRDCLMRYLLETRPDVQPDVLDAWRYAVFEFAKYVAEISPMNILGFDGGPIDLVSNRSGQLAHDFSSPVPWRGTTELDLYFRTAAPTVIEVVDYKTGYKTWTPSTIYGSFQFQFIALLVMLNFPECAEVHFVVWSPRHVGKSPPVVFQRKRMQEWEARVKMAALAYFKNKGLPLDQVEAWPGEDKCSFCPVARYCQMADRDTADIESNPEAFADQLFAVQAKLEAMSNVGKAFVKKTGKDVVSSTGAAFGFQKPKRASSPRFAIYPVKASKEQAASAGAAAESEGDE